MALTEVRDHLSRYVRQAEREHIVITRHGKPAGVLIGFESEDEWFEYKLENDLRFLERIARARAGLQAGKGMLFEEIDTEDDLRTKTSSRRAKGRRPSSKL